MAVLLGRTSAGTSADFVGNGHPTAWKFTASASGTLAAIFAQFKVANPSLTSVELGFYADDAGGSRPGTRLATATATTGITGTGSFSVTGLSVAVTSGVAYWLAWRGVGEQVDFQGTAAGSYLEQGTSAALANPWPATGGSSGTINAIIWGEDAGGTTQVSTTRRVVYNVQKNVASTRRVNYAVQASVVATRRVSYAVLAAVAATRRVTYNVLANVAATRRVAYDVAASTTQVAATRRVVYSVTAQVSATRRVRYDVLASVLASRRVAYAVLAPVAATRRVTYDVAAGTTQVAATRRIAYSVLAQVASGRHVYYIVGDASPVTVQLIVVAHGVRQPSVPTTRHRG